jgi:uncharacterized membrane protein
MNPRSLTNVALASLVGLAIVSLAFAFVQPAHAGGSGMPPGLALALVKVVVLAVVFWRVLRADIYGMQWSSMLILLFIAEAAVRAMSDPPPSAAVGWVEGLLALSYFAAILGILRPLKQAARRARDHA